MPIPVLSPAASASTSNSASEAIGTGTDEGTDDSGITGGTTGGTTGGPGSAADTADPITTVTVEDPAVPLGTVAADERPAAVTRINDQIIPLAAAGGMEDRLLPADEEAPLPFTITENEEDLIRINDEEVPLAVMNEEEEASEELTEIEDVETAMTGAPTGIWWSWIPVIGAAASAVDGYRRNKRSKKEQSDTKQ